MKTTAGLISKIFSPEVSFFLFFLVVSFYINKDVIEGIIVTGFSLASLTFLLWKKKKAGALNDDAAFLDPNIRTIRYLTFTLTIGVSLIYIFFSILNQRQTNLIFFLIVLIDSIVLLITARYMNLKISAHIVYTGLIVLFFLPALSKYAVFLLLSMVVGWARVSLRKHTLVQVVLGVIIVLTSFITFDLITHSVSIQ